MSASIGIEKQFVKLKTTNTFCQCLVSKACGRVTPTYRRIVGGYGQTGDVPKQVRVAVPTPGDVVAATEAFGSELRVHLIRFFAQHPGARQVEAVRALGVERAAVSFNTGRLVDLGVLISTGDRTYSVDEAVSLRLRQALRDFVSPA